MGVFTLINLEMIVGVTANKKGDYVMIEVPISAGCSYGHNTKELNSLKIR
jgi:hypothetical protein